MKILLFILLGLLIHQILVFCYFVYIDSKISKDINIEKYLKIFSPIPYYLYISLVGGTAKIIRYLFGRKCFYYDDDDKYNIYLLVEHGSEDLLETDGASCGFYPRFDGKRILLSDLKRKIKISKMYKDGIFIVIKEERD